MWGLTVVLGLVACDGEIRFAAEDADDGAALTDAGGNCAREEDCTAPNTTCDLPTHRCLTRCSAAEGCPSLVPVCDLVRGVCTGCVREDQCVGKGARAHCDIAQGRCVECLSDVDCKSPGRTRCDTTVGECLGKS